MLPEFKDWPWVSALDHLSEFCRRGRIMSFLWDYFMQNKVSNFASTHVFRISMSLLQAAVDRLPTPPPLHPMVQTANRLAAVM